jgi:PleD family two-component response regulator
MGIANWNYANPVGLEILLEQADRALYQAKETGRNNIIVWDEADRYGPTYMSAKTE